MIIDQYFQNDILVPNILLHNNISYNELYMYMYKCININMLITMQVLDEADLTMN